MKCEHCKIDFKTEQMIIKDINNLQKAFCCEGCFGVWTILHNENLDEFYTRLKNNTLSPIGSKQQININHFEKFISTDENGFKKASFILENIHCEACVWLNEKVLTNLDGVLEINISNSTHKADIVYDDEVISLKQILEKIISLGYIPTAYNPILSQKAQESKREFYIKLILAIACVMNVMWLSVAKYAGFFSGMDANTKDIINFAEFIFASAVLFYTGGAFFKSAFNALKNKFLNMDVLVISGASLVYIYSIVAMFLRLENVYFDSVAMIICFVFIGKYLELASRKNALDNIDLITELLDDSVLKKQDDTFIKTPLNQININDIIKLSIDDKVLIDGIITQGEASFDTSHITGESKPFKASINDEIISGYKLINGSCEYKCTKTFENSTLNKIIQTLNQTQKSGLEKLVNKISSYFTVGIFMCFVLCFLFWINKSSFEISLINAISVLIIACPCALALATPVCTLVSTNLGFKNKILFKKSSVIEDLSKCDMVLFDKTGVLTNPKLISKINLDEEKKILLKSFCSLSNHIICKQIYKHLKDTKVINLDLFAETKGYGISAKYKNMKLLGGSYEFMKQNNIKAKEVFNTHFYFAIDDVVVALFEFENVVDDGAKNLINYLDKIGIKSVIVSGDNETSVKDTAEKLGIKSYHFSSLPHDKLEIIKNYSNSHKIIMVGDGVNDALALKYAHVGISLKNASNIAIDSSDVVFLDNKLISLEKAIKLSKKCFIKIKQNLAFSLIYNLCGVYLAFCGFINPLLASVLMSLSSLVVVINALSIKRLKL